MYTPSEWYKNSEGFTVPEKEEYLCDAEVGGNKEGWRTCFKPACYEAINTNYAIITHYCQEHKDWARAAGRTIIREI